MLFEEKIQQGPIGYISLHQPIGLGIQTASKPATKQAVKN